MALSDTLTKLSPQAVPTRNRLDTLFDSLDAEDQRVLREALNNRSISSAMLTKALRVEYGQTVVKDGTVADWRRRNQSEIDGL